MDDDHGMGRWPQQQGLLSGSWCFLAMENESELLKLLIFSLLGGIFSIFLCLILNPFFFVFFCIFQLQLPVAINMTDLTGQLTGNNVDELLKSK